jgi:hypothetical protein
MLRRQTEREEKAQQRSATTVALLSLNTNNDKNGKELTENKTKSSSSS